jgi:hypothetical protein
MIPCEHIRVWMKIGQIHVYTVKCLANKANTQKFPMWFQLGPQNKATKTSKVKVQGSKYVPNWFLAEGWFPLFSTLPFGYLKICRKGTLSPSPWWNSRIFGGEPWDNPGPLGPEGPTSMMPAIIARTFPKINMYHWGRLKLAWSRRG